MIVFNSVTIDYDGKRVFKNLSFKVSQGEQLILVGESGKGKTTILNAIMGFVLPVEGKIIVDNTPLTEKSIKEIRGKISWLPQQVNIYSETVAELFYSVFKLKENKRLLPGEDQIKDMFAKLNLETELLDRKIDEISGGQKQRIILASLLLLNKPIILLDEPTSALDTQNSRNIFEILKNSGKTVVAATHDRFWIENSDKILEL